MNDVKYAGFWIRTAAALIDTTLILAIIVPALTMIYGQEYWLGERIVFGFWDLMFNWVLPALAVLVFWIYKSATPGKMAVGVKIVDEKTGGKPSVGQLVGRYLAYYVSIIPMLLGLFWVGVDKRKQGWHDKLAGTLVIHISKEQSEGES